MTFNITDYVDFDQKGRARCPNCDPDGKKGKSLSLVPGSDGAYKCFRGCTPADIRDALGQAKNKIIPAALAPAKPARSVTVTPQKIHEANERLLNESAHAIGWLLNRGITAAMARYYRLGCVRSKVGKRHLWSVSIPIPADAEGLQYYQKKRIEPWKAAEDQPPDYQPWSQFGIPQMVYLTHHHPEATATWLCEGEWDAIVLGWAMRDQKEVAVACFTCGAGNVPPAAELEKLPGKVVIFYDADEPGQKGAEKAARAIGQRARIATVPQPDSAPKGWDVSNAINAGFELPSFHAAAAAARAVAEDAIEPAAGLRSRIVTHDELMARAPDFTDWLVPDLLTANELFLLAATPRAGKSLMAMTLAQAVASGGKFLGRPCTQGAVLYIRCEDGEAKVKERALAQGWAEGLPVYWLDKFKLNQLDELQELIEELNIRLVVLDTLSRIKSATVNENSAEMSQMLDPLQDMAMELNCCVLLVHHTVKVSIDNAGSIDIFDTIRGSTAIRGVCRGAMILAASEQKYRLVAENGWGKHDLDIVLDANTTQWKLLGNWMGPKVEPSQKDRVLEFLSQVGAATIEKIAEETNLPKKSLYEVLKRLQADDLVEKHGERRSSVYSKAAIQHIQQLNTVLKSQDAEPAIAESAFQQKQKISSTSEKVITDSKSDQQTVHELYQTPETGSDSGFVTLPQNDHFSESDLRETGAVEYVSNAEPASISAIQQPFQLLNTLKEEEDFKALPLGTKLKIWEKGRWLKALYVGLHSNSRVSPKSGALETAIRVNVGNQGRRAVVTIDCVELVGGADNADG